MPGPVRGNFSQIAYKFVTYVSIVFGGTVSGALVGSLAGPIRLQISTENLAILGACIGATFAIVGCKFAMEHREAMERNRELFQALDLRLSRVAQAAEPSAHGQ